MSGSADDPSEQLRRDRRRERQLLWRGLAACAITVVVALMRQAWWT